MHLLGSGLRGRSPRQPRSFRFPICTADYLLANGGLGVIR